MKATNLPKDTVLYQLLEKCKVSHHMHLYECHDGAMIMECGECPFHRVLDSREEDIMRQQVEKLPSF